MCEHGRSLDGRTVARGRHRQSGELRLGRRRGRGLRGARVQARLGRWKGWEDGQIEPKSCVNFKARNSELSIYDSTRPEHETFDFFNL